ncbi:MAG: Dyp-type peroxidase [Actinobacteria bacterium]|nr:Dyp-type peroxidase [Actinomycetota bacterium]
MSPTFVDTGELQDGIYLSPAIPPPNGFLMLTIQIEDGTDAAAARTGVERIWGVLTDLHAGMVRDLRATKEGEEDQPIRPGTFDFLLGYGASFFDPAKSLTEAERPAQLTPLARPREPFANLPWAAGGHRGGESDLCLQLTGRDSQATSRAAVEVWKVIVDDELPLVITGSFEGFARDDGRSWIGFHDGVSNIRPSQRLAAVECQGDPGWNRGGTYLAFLRCAVDLGRWRSLSRSAQELVVGRDKLTGCALEGTAEADGELAPRAYAGCPAAPDAPPQDRDKFRDPPETGDPVVEASHIHRANQNRVEPTSHAGHRIFRQGYEYLAEIGPGGPDLGLNFVSFQRDLEHLWQILGLPSWLGGVNFGGRPDRGPGEPEPIELLSLEAAGFYAVPPREQPFPGAGLFGS